MIDNAHKYICNDYAEMWAKGNVIYITYLKGVVADIKVARKMLEDRLILAEGKLHFVHGDCRGVKYWTGESRDFFNTKENLHNVVAGTIVYSNSHVLKVIINFYLRFNKPAIPVKLCTSEKEAFQWLSRFEGFGLNKIDTE